MKKLEIDIGNEVKSAFIDDAGRLSVIVMHDDDATDLHVRGSDTDRKISWAKTDIAVHDRIKIRVMSTDRKGVSAAGIPKSDSELLDEYRRLKEELQNSGEL